MCLRMEMRTVLMLYEGVFDTDTSFCDRSSLRRVSVLHSHARVLAANAWTGSLLFDFVFAM